MTGVVVRILLNQGFGFIRGEDNIQRFAHRQNFLPPEAFDCLREGVGVTFEPSMHPKGARAEQLRVIASALSAPEEGGNR